jgi:hypothetical protein
MWNTWPLRGEGARTRVGVFVPRSRSQTRRSDPGTWDRASDEMPAPRALSHFESADRQPLCSSRLTVQLFHATHPGTAHAHAQSRVYVSATVRYALESERSHEPTFSACDGGNVQAAIARCCCIPFAARCCLGGQSVCSFAQGERPALSGHGNTRAGPVLVLRYHHPTRGRLSESHTERYHFLPSFAQSLILKIAPTMSRHPFLRHKRRGARHQAGGCAAAL